MARRFSRAERAALYLAAQGRCSRCGALLEPGWHGDHIQPWARGGPTDVANGQALCPRCNLIKGGRVDHLRRWQRDALSEYQLWRSDGNSGFLVEATPGAGKTRFAIEVATQLMSAKKIARVVIAVPTSRLEGQWAEAFAAQGININPRWHAADGSLAADEHGCAATYAEIANSSANFRLLTSRVSTLVILDEIHHCGDDRSWGTGVKDAFELAAERLLLSGTPFRSDNNAIPFVRYVDGKGAPDFRYGYDQALADGVVRAVFFPRRGGRMEWTTYSGEHMNATFDEPMGNSLMQQRLRTALSLAGEWLPSVIGDANNQLRELRETDSRAGGIVFCEDTNTARGVVKMLNRVGQNPVLAISEEPEADERIRQFAGSSDPWLVSIRKVSEGVDIPRLRVGVYATPWLTELFFRQVVGRLVRTRPDEEDPTGYLFIPDDERLRAMAQQIKAQRDHVLNAEEDELLDADSVGSGEVERSEPSSFTPISAMAMDRGVIVDEGTISPEEMANAERVKKLSPETSSVSTVAVAMLLRNSQPDDPTRTTLFDLPEPQQPPELSLSDRKQRLKKANSTAVARINKTHGVEYPKINLALNMAAGLAAQRGMNSATEEQLRKRLGIAHDWLKTGQPPVGA